MIFAGGTVLAFLPWAWRGGARSWRQLVLGCVAIGAIVISVSARGPLVVPLIALMASSAGLWLSARRGIVSFRVVHLSLASDLFAALALTALRTGTISWATPAPGSWHAGAWFAGAAAVLRCLSAATAHDWGSAGGASSGVWIGLAIAWWVGASGAPILGAGAVLLLLLAARAARRPSGSISQGIEIGAALGLVLAASGAEPIVIALPALAGVAFALGERALSIVVLGAAPFSIVDPVHTTNPVLLGALAILLLLAMGVGAKARYEVGGTGGRLLAGVAIGTSIVRLGTHTLKWALLAVIIAASVSYQTMREGPPSEEPIIMSAPIEEFPAWPSFVLITATVLLVVRLVVTGLRTSFL